MCGIAGFLSSNINPDVVLGDMINAINHRGPDDKGTWFDKNVGIGFAHSRLSILDLSSAGHQPMHSVSNNFVLIFNGEIYNHNKLREELDFVSHRTLEKSRFIMDG